MTTPSDSKVRAALGFVQKGAKRTAGFATISAATQAIAVLSGLIVVRVLDKADYALYGIAIAAVTATAALSDAGIRSTLLAAVGGVYRDGGRMAPHFRRALRMRHGMVLAVVPPLGALTLYMLVGNGASSPEAVLIVVLLVAAAVPDTTSSLLWVALQVSDRTRPMQLVLLGAAVVRLALIVALWLVPVASVPAFLAVQAVVAFGQLLITKRLARAETTDDGDPEGPERLAPRAPYKRALMHTLPLTATAMAAPQLVNLALTEAGNTDGIAEIAALTRFAMVFVVVRQVTDNLVAPAIARSERTRAATLRATRVVVAFYALAVMAFVLATWILGDFLLALLGPQYAGLNTELVLIAAGTGIASLANDGLGAVSHARGWTTHGWAYAPLFVLWAGITLLTVDISTSLGAAIMFSSMSLVSLASHIVRYLFGYHHLES
ncbi:hypothetical protein [Demequina rhizosphaerae]|uniref:hypothetical protein n=1 Tax=Demequina rhizosphaerae TaxID=1638985 RepID=UPI000781DDB7|nr:hypothetical protein [Demequina rhizosphaerae]